MTDCHMKVWIYRVVFVLQCIVLVAGSSTSACPLSGPKSSAPLNEKEFMKNLDYGLQKLEENLNKAGRFDGNVVSTCINEEAAIHNFPAFLKSTQTTSPPFHNSLIVFTLDAASQTICQRSILDTSCVFMDLGIAGNSLAPGGADQQNDDYWRLTYGRVFATKALVRPGINAVPVDVDAIFLQNPFAPGNGIAERPNDVAVVSDIAPFTFTYGDKTPINGGFLYFPGIVTTSHAHSKEIVTRIWAKNCHPKSNEQLVTSSVLRYMRRKYREDPTHQAYMLPAAQYLNFCSTDCGTGAAFSSIRTVDDLRAMERTYGSSPKFKDCSEEGRKKWVYFHAACLDKNNITKSDVAKTKGSIQMAVYKWIKGENA